MRAIIQPAAPKQCELIATGKQNVIVVKTCPKEVPFKGYLLCVNGDHFLARKSSGAFWTAAPYSMMMPIGSEQWTYRVIGEFVCDEIIKYAAQSILCAYYEVNCEPRYEPQDTNSKSWIKGTCMSYSDMVKLSQGKDLHGLHVSQLIIYDKPLLLESFRKEYERDNEGFIKCGYTLCPHVKGNGHYKYNCVKECPDLAQRYAITRLPRRWLYVEEVNRQ